jgi:hypothetical protein
VLRTTARGILRRLCTRTSCASHHGAGEIMPLAAGKKHVQNWKNLSEYVLVSVTNALLNTQSKVFNEKCNIILASYFQAFSQK